MMNTAACRCVWLGLLAIAGCGRSDIHPVKGSVRYPDGSPVIAGKVILDSGSSSIGSWGSILPDGTFQMGTHSPTDGVTMGEHRVAIVGACIYPPPDSTAQPTQLVHERYRNPATSGIVFRVPEMSTWDIVVEPAKKRKDR